MKLWVLEYRTLEGDSYMMGVYDDPEKAKAREFYVEEGPVTWAPVYRAGGVDELAWICKDGQDFYIIYATNLNGEP